jgi:hypothetical protein
MNGDSGEFPGQCLFILVGIFVCNQNIHLFSP